MLLRKYWPGLLVCAGFLMMMDAVISSLLTCHPPINGGGGSQNSNENCTILQGPLLSLIIFIGNFVGDHDKGIVAAFTVILAISTIGLWVSTNHLWSVTRIAAEHIPRVERAYLHGGGEPIGEDPWNEDSFVKNFPTFRLDINNHGKTPGELLEFGIGWCKISELDSLPPLPKYKWYYYRDFVQSGVPRSIKDIKMPSDIPMRDTVIFGRFGYRDIFEEPHSNGFVQHGGNPIKPPHESYVKADPVWDLPYVGDKDARKYEEDN